MINFTFTNPTNQVGLDSVLEYLNKITQIFEMDYALILIATDNPTRLLDIKDIVGISGFSEYIVRKILYETQLKVIVSSNRFQISVEEFRMFIHRDLTPKSPYWKHLKSLKTKGISNETIIEVYNNFLNILTKYNQALSFEMNKLMNLTNTLMDSEKISNEFNWSKRLARRILADEKLDTVAISNKVQVDRNSLLTFIAQNLSEELTH